MRDLVWLTEARAIELGFTHEGTSFGLPAWIQEVDEDTYVACPKFTSLQLYCIAMDTLLTWFAIILPPNFEVVTPIYPKRKLDGRKT